VRADELPSDIGGTMKGMELLIMLKPMFIFWAFVYLVTIASSVLMNVYDVPSDVQLIYTYIQSFFVGVGLVLVGIYTYRRHVNKGR
jgi:hypothetical protein